MGKESFKRLDLSISGMHCASCVARIEKTLTQADGVKEVRVNLATENASILYDPTKTAPLHFTKAIQDLGFGIKKEKIVLPIQGMSCASCVNRVETALIQIPGYPGKCQSGFAKCDCGHYSGKSNSQGFSPGG